MFSKVFIFCGCLFILSGCAYNNEPMPEIAYDYTPNNKIIQPMTVKPTRTATNVHKESIPSGWQPPRRLEKKWTAIVIHHSGTQKGNAAIFDEWHRVKKHWAGVGYDFVIGNGTNSADGQVEVTFRWQQQRTGAHCSTPGNWANKEAVGICLVGNFDNTVPTMRQMQSLVKLVRFLQSRYGIPKSRIYGHRTTPGAHKTDCPGRKFSIARLKSMLGS